jgi:hypothetical protein
MHRKSGIRSLARRVSISVLIGLCIALIGSILEGILEHHSALGIQAVDDFVVGVMVALLVFAYEQGRYRTIVNKIRVITAMNHHVRNALQTIAYAPYTEQEKQIRLIQDSVNRIQWALREILPAEESAPDSLFANASAPGSHPPPPRSAGEGDLV